MTWLRFSHATGKQSASIPVIAVGLALALGLTGCGVFSSSELPDRSGRPALSDTGDAALYVPDRESDNGASGRFSRGFGDDERSAGGVFAPAPSESRGSRAADPDGNDRVARAPAVEIPDLPSANGFLGLRPERVSLLLGKPFIVRRDEPSQVWQYRVDDCVLDVFLRRRAALSPYQVIYVEGRDRLGSAQSSAEMCLEAVFRRKHQAPTS